jgi:hypothetical protein
MNLAEFAGQNGVRPLTLFNRMEKIRLHREAHRLEPYSKSELAIAAIGEIKTRMQYKP